MIRKAASIISVVVIAVLTIPSAGASADPAAAPSSSGGVVAPVATTLAEPPVALTTEAATTDAATTDAATTEAATTEAATTEAATTEAATTEAATTDAATTEAATTDAATTDAATTDAATTDAATTDAATTDATTTDATTTTPTSGTPAVLPPVVAPAPQADEPPGPVGLTLVATSHLTDVNRNSLRDIGDSIAFTYALKNSGTVLEQGLTVTDPVATVTCSQSSLAAGSATACSSSRKVTLADMNRGTIVSSAVANGFASDGRAVTVRAASVSVSLSVVTRLATRQRLVRLLDVNKDGRIGAGDRIVYGFTVTNTGNVTLSRVTVVDAFLRRSSLVVRCAATNLVPGRSTSCTAGAYTFTAADVRRGTVQNYSAATATAPSGKVVRSNSAVVVQPVAGRVVVSRPVVSRPAAVKPRAPQPPRIPRPSIDLRQWVLRIDDNNRDGLVDQGDGLVYGFRVSNTGGTPVTRIAIDDARLTRLGVRISCPAQTLVPGASVTCVSGVYTASAFSMTRGVGSNYASATAVSSAGKQIRSNSTVVTLAVGVRTEVALAAGAPSAVAVARSPGLAFTGSPVELLLRWAGGLIAGGFVLARFGRKTARSS